MRFEKIRIQCNSDKNLAKSEVPGEEPPLVAEIFTLKPNDSEKKKTEARCLSTRVRKKGRGGGATEKGKFLFLFRRELLVFFQSIFRDSYLGKCLQREPEF